MAFKQEVNVPMLFTTAIIGAVVLVVLVLGTQAWFESSEEAELNAKITESPRSEFAELKRTQYQNIQRYGWLDPNKTVAAIPVGQAMELIAKNGGVPATQP